MFESQHTVKEAVSLTGTGLHTGASVTLTILPAEENSGYRFRRVDLPGNPEVPANADYVVDTSRGTTIALDKARVHTVEHTLAALAGLQIDNALIEINGPEPPALDGSSHPIMQELVKAGIQDQRVPRTFFEVDTPIHYSDSKGNVDLAALPLNDFRISVMVDYNSPILGSQHASLLDITQFEKEIAPSRTFCFVHELEYLYTSGLIKGGDLSNAIVVVDRELNPEEIGRLAKLFNHPGMAVVKEGYLNNVELRYQNEPARHKLLDLVGDLALVGHPLKAQILAARPGHSANVQFAQKIRSAIRQKRLAKKYQTQEKEGVVFDINAIEKILPHRYPFLLVDKVTEFSENKITGIKNVTISEPYFQGHFPGNPVMPGVLQLEAMAQVGGILLLNKVEDPSQVWVYFLAIDNARFKKTVIPGDTLEFQLEMLQFKRNICKMKGQAFVRGSLVCEAELTAAIVKKEETPVPQKQMQTQ